MAPGNRVRAPHPPAPTHGVESGESVYKMVAPPKAEGQGQSFSKDIYKSKHAGMAALPPSCSTMGLHGSTKVAYNQAGREREPPKAAYGLSKRSQIDDRDRTVNKAPLVNRREKPVMGLVTDKNFVRDNAVEMMHSTAVRKFPDTVEPPTQQDTFGKVPEYVRRRQRELAAEKAAKASTGAANQSNNLALMTDAVKQELLAGLNKKWQENHKQYQKLTFATDTVAKVQRKEGLELEMDAIEKAMQKLQKKNIYIYDDE